MGMEMLPIQTFLRLGVAAACCGALLWADLVTKAMARTFLLGQAAIPVIPGFWAWKYAENRDVGFSLLRAIPEAQRQYLILAAVAMGIVAVGVYGFRQRERLLALSGITLVLAGAIGNLTDRVLRGFVTDFVLWYYGDFYWPVFNLADVYVVIGVCLLFIHELRLGAEGLESPPNANASDTTSEAPAEQRASGEPPSPA